MDCIGYEWLRRSLDLTAFEVRHPARVRPVTRVLPGDGLLAVPAHVAPQGDDPLEHVLFALKHEGVDLQVLAQALPRVEAERLAAVLAQTPNGQYIRVACFLWERFTGRMLPSNARIGGKYHE